MDRQVREELYHASSGPLQMSGPLPPLSGILEEVPPSKAEAQKLLKRTPRSYLLNQAYGFWFFASWFFLTIIITRTLNNTDYGVYAVALSAFNTIAYVVALGLEDATVTFVPRVLAEHGQAAAALLSRRLLGLRIAILMLSVVIMVFTLPLLAALIAIIPIQGSGNVAAGLRDPKLLGHILPIAIYVLGNGISGLLTALCAAVMRMRIVFIIGGITQLLLLIIGFIVLHLGWGVDGMLWLLAVSSLLNALAFALWQAPFLFARGATYKQAMKPVVRLGISAWLTNLVSGALLKQVSIILLGKNYERLAVSWQTLIKIESLLAAPVLVFCLFNAQNIATTLYGTNFDPVGPLLAIFLFFNIFVRVLGTTIHQSTLYVVGRARLVVLSQWVGLIVVILLGLLLIPLNGPTHGPAGALVADGLAQVITGALLLVFLARDLPRKYPLGFTLRLLLALTIAALPSIIWHPTNRILLGISGGIFLILSFGLLLLIKPLSAEDLEMIADVNPMVAKYLKWFARGQGKP